MEKSLKDELLQIRDLEGNIKASSQILKREKARLEALQKECKHDIVILVDIPSPGYSVEAKCLFCGQHYNVPHELRGLPETSTLIEACDCKKLQYYSKDDIYEFIASEAEIATLRNPNITKEELSEHLKQLLKEN